MFKEFRDFISRGNVMNLAVAVIIGAAFTAIVTSLVNDIVMPIIGILVGGLDFSTLVVQVGEASITYGNFIQAIINFILIALVVFIMVKAVNSALNTVKKPKEEAPPEPPKPTPEVELLTEIRDLLNKN